MGDKIEAPITSDMGWDTMFGEDMDDKEVSKFLCSDFINCRDKDTLLGKSVGRVPGLAAYTGLRWMVMTGSKYLHCMEVGT
jgi:hypothetical protein